MTELRVNTIKGQNGTSSPSVSNLRSRREVNSSNSDMFNYRC